MVLKVLQKVCLSGSMHSSPVFRTPNACKDVEQVSIESVLNTSDDNSLFIDNGIEPCCMMYVPERYWALPPIFLPSMRISYGSKPSKQMKLFLFVPDSEKSFGQVSTA